MSDSLRQLPSVHDLADRASGEAWARGQPRTLLVRAVRAVVDHLRAEIQRGALDPGADSAELLRRVRRQLSRESRAPLRPVINATGIIIHTGLGRAPLASQAAAALESVARGYAPVELDMRTGERGKRSHIVRDLLCDLTGAESAAVVNNNAAALMITLATFARDRSVIVSRGELIEIGGSFRLPEVMKTSGAILREVGTTNKTRLADYENAIGPSTAALLKVHPSNYRVEGFTQSPPLADLAALARQRDLILIDDIGSGLLHPSDLEALRDEPDASTSLEQGTDLVLFSGDKLLGGPQAGIIAGRGDLIERIEKNPLMRALRVGKLTLTALASTLQLHRHGRDVPVQSMIRADLGALRARAEAFALQVRSIERIESSDVVPCEAFAGGGSVPTQAIPSVAVRIRVAGRTEDEVMAALRGGDPPVIARRRDGAVWFDLRTITPEEEAMLLSAIRAAVA